MKVLRLLGIQFLSSVTSTFEASGDAKVAVAGASTARVIGSAESWYVRALGRTHLCRSSPAPSSSARPLAEHGLQKPCQPGNTPRHFKIRRSASPKYGCAMASLAVRRSRWSYRKSLSSKSIASLEM